MPPSTVLLTDRPFRWVLPALLNTATALLAQETPAPTGGAERTPPAFQFRHHFISDNLPTGRLNGVQSLADYDRDGDLDMTVGSVQAGLFLLRNDGREWKPLPIGKVPFTSLGAAALDVDGDGWPDLVSASVWYRNERDGQFSMHTYDPTFQGSQHIHDLVTADLNGDGDLDLVSKVWNPWEGSANQGRSHADFMENLRIDRRRTDGKSTAPDRPAQKPSTSNAR